MKAPLWRVASDYIGAGKYILATDRIIVGTEYGVQCVPRPRASGHGKGGAHRQPAEGSWKAQLGSRCIGVVPGPDHTALAACLDGLFVLGEDGVQRWGTHSLKEIVHGPVALQGGVLLSTRSSIHFVRESEGSVGSVWRYDFTDSLGSSVEQVRLVNVFEQNGHIVVGAVDYDSGIGRVVVLDGRSGKRTWMSDPGPISELFQAGQATFVWCQTGYGKFETHLTRADGREIWQKDFAGVGASRPDGSLAMVVGSNESPTWDDWEYRQVSPNGKVEVALKGTGRCPVRPLVRKDGAVFFLGSVLPVDLGSSRLDYTSFFAMPQEVLFQHLMGIKPQLPEYDITLHRYREGEESLEIVFELSGSFSFADLAASGSEVILCDGRDIIAVEG